MKIDTVIFSASLEFSPFWNIQSQVWNGMGINPVLVVWADEESDFENRNLSMKYGQVIENIYDKRFPKVLQVTMSKFFYASSQADRVCMIGDIDLIPLQSDYFTDPKSEIEINNSTYAHLGVSNDDFLLTPWEPSPKGVGRARLVGQYHVAKGNVYKKLFFDGASLYDVVNHVVTSDAYGNRCGGKENHQYHWCAEEDYTTRMVSDSLSKKKIDKFYFKSPIDLGKRIERKTDYTDEFTGYDYDERLRDKYIDLHCYRPYEKQESEMMKILKYQNMI